MIGGVYLDDAIYCWTLASALLTTPVTKNRETTLMIPTLVPQLPEYCGTKLPAQLVDSKCNWPGCDSSAFCPRLGHPDRNHNARNPVEYFSYFGLVNYDMLSRKLGVNMSELRKMDYETLMRKLVGVEMQKLYLYVIKLIKPFQKIYFQLYLNLFFSQKLEGCSLIYLNGNSKFSNILKL